MRRFELLCAAMALALAPAMAGAAPWEKVDQLPGGIAVEIDRASVATIVDGERAVAQAVFRRELPFGIMETSVSVDCGAHEAKIRRVLMLGEGDVVITDNHLQTAEYTPINEGSAEEIYHNALCLAAEEAGSE